MSRLRGDADDEMAAAQRRHAARDAEDWRKDRAASEEMWIQGERARKMERGHNRPSGNWRFTQILNAYRELTGWRVELNQRLIGLIVIRGNDLAVISAADNPEEPDATEIMAAFIKLYPDPSARSLPEPRRELPAGSEFGPSRDWSEE